MDTSIFSKRIASATLLGGPHASAYLDRARPLGFTGEIFSEMIGQASAAKMCRSVIIKGIEALVSESMLAARCYGVEKEVLHSLSDLLPVGDWEKLARYLISRGLEHGARRAQEMREAARTVKEAGIEPLMSMATAARQDWSAAHRDAFVHADDLARMLDAMREANVANIYPLLGGEEDTNLPPGKIDWVLLVDAYHEFSRPEAMLASIRASLAPDGRVALVEYRAEGEKGSLERIPASHKMSNEDVMKEWTAAGFELVERIDSLPAQHLFIFKSAGGAVSAADAWHRNLRVASLELGQVPNLSSFGDAIYFSGQPTAADIDLFAGRGVKTVINLRSAQEMQSLDFDEKALVEKAGMNYVHVPMGRDVPGEDDLERILSHLDNAGSDRVLLHCGSSNRVGLIWSVFRSVRHGLGLEEALADGKAAGMASSALQARARDYITRATNP
ncbi:DUF1932 domain-containing protein [Candidatus Sumerlaeota bacterium]|nr:DUF1932 domain-containing protein [Candidatus Sumerlaeota bacterium]